MMYKFRRFGVFFTAFLLYTALATAQYRPIGYWESLFPYRNSFGVATDGRSLYALGTLSFFIVDPSGQMHNFSKVEGMSDVGVSCIAYDNTTSTLILAYQNSNIDLYYDSIGTFVNIPDLKIKNIAGTKKINHVYIENSVAYISTDIGVLVLDLLSKNIRETYSFAFNNQNAPVSYFNGLGNYFYAATGTGVYRADKSNQQLQNLAQWGLVDSVHKIKYMASVNNTLFLAGSDSVFVLNNDTLKYIYNSKTTINHIDAGNEALWVAEYNPLRYRGLITKIDMNYKAVDSFHCNQDQPMQVVEKNDGSVWVAGFFNGLFRRDGPDGNAYYFPGGPSDVGNYDIYAYDHDVWVAHGGYTDLRVPGGNKQGISHLSSDGKWNNYVEYGYYPFGDSMADFVAIVKDKVDGSVYAGSFASGLFVLSESGNSQILKQNSILEPSIPNNIYQVTGLAIDQQDNLWLTMYGSPHELFAKSSTGNWYKFFIPVSDNYPNDAGSVIVDDYDHIWYLLPNGGGVVVYDYNGTIDNPADDKHRIIKDSLPSGNTYSIAKDKNGDIWVGTDNGIGIISNNQDITAINSINIPIVQYDQYAGKLFSLQTVNTIAVDGANRKWVGTTNGVWLLSPSADKMIYKFNIDNSPLPSNNIQKISIDPVWGDVYIGTDNGLISFRGTATEGGTSNQHVVCYPNPVPSAYKGTIAIKGLVDNADVRITDISGQLVYKTTALGGQAVWSGVDYTGHRPQSGVYLIFITNKDGSQTNVSKMVFMN